MNTKNLSISELRSILTLEENKILTMYLQRNTQKQICESLKIKRGKIDLLVKKYNLTRFRDRKNCYCKNVNPQNPNFWYFLGLFASDGNLYCKSKSVNTIQFTLDDRDALEDVLNILECNKIIKEYKRGNKIRYYIDISDATLVSTVQNIFGSHCYRKTFKITYPKIPNEYCEIMFLRGFIDGDGSFAKSKSSGFYNFKIYCASINFINCLYKKLYNMFKEKVHFYKGKYIEINDKYSMYKFLKYLYSYNPKIGMKRKRDRAIQHINSYNQRYSPSQHENVG